MMLRGLDGAMLRLLGFLLLSSLCSAMLTQDPTSIPRTEPYSEDKDHEMESHGAAVSRSHHLPGSHDDNMTGGYDGYQMGAPDMSPLPNLDICHALMNQPVPPPMDQVPIFCLCSYCKGTAGPKGDDGDQGPPGAPGSPGKRGLTGYRGRPGFTGRPGIKGQKGDLGDKGQPGVTGFTGMKGSRGLKGEKGDHGMEGPPGDQGPKGETGTCPASCETIQGPEGPQGVPGPAGGRGLPGVKGSVGPKGAKGMKGDMGSAGEPGSDGLKGEQGEMGICECTDGADGSKGESGPTGDKGAKGNPGAMGVKGDMGPKGSEGSMGHMGPPGPCSPTIQSAFSAALNESYPRQDFPVSFPIVFTNILGSYDPLLGVYTAPFNGTYVFSFHLAVYRRPLKVGLYVNFYPIIRMTDSSLESGISQSIVLHLNSLDMVWLQVKDGITNGMFSGSEKFSTFSGFLLYADSCEMHIARNYWQRSIPDFGNCGWDGPRDMTTTAAP